MQNIEPQWTAWVDDGVNETHTCWILLLIHDGHCCPFIVDTVAHIQLRLLPVYMLDNIAHIRWKWLLLRHVGRICLCYVRHRYTCTFGRPVTPCSHITSLQYPHIPGNVSPAICISQPSCQKSGTLNDVPKHIFVIYECSWNSYLAIRPM